MLCMRHMANDLVVVVQNGCQTPPNRYLTSVTDIAFQFPVFSVFRSCKSQIIIFPLSHFFVQIIGLQIATMEITFREKRVLVTGAGQGIGRGIAKRLAQNGAKVVALGRTRAHLDSLKAKYPNIEIISVDLEDWDKTKEALKNLGHVDALVNNAAIAQLAPFLEVKSEEFDKTFSINVKSIINVSQIVAKEWVENKTGGSIVNISSQASQAALKDHAIYCASKSAVDGLSRSMALELGPHNIRVNCVNPTVIMTDMGRIGWSDPKKADPMRAKIPLGRFGEVDEVVDAVLYLLSDKASMINGVTLPIDGGFLAT